MAELGKELLMTFGEWITETGKSYILDNHGQRMGQYFYNQAFHANRDAVDSVITEFPDSDPFHNDGVLDAFLIHLGEVWA